MMQVTDSTELVFKTYTGSSYWVKGGKVKRLNYAAGKRGDGEWLTLVNLPDIRVGQSACLMLEPINHLGDDDSGRPTQNEEVHVTVRTTSEVTVIEVLDEPMD